MLAGGQLSHIVSSLSRTFKNTLNACDFGDLLLHMITILRDPKHADVLADYHQRFKYILVDEYQDTNVAQYMWLRLLAQKSNNICCVGDDDQSIYGWRGAEVGNILKFEHDFPGAKIIRLEQNYRSTGHILAAASGVIAQQRRPAWKNAVVGSRAWRKNCRARPVGWPGGSALDRRGNRGAAEQEMELEPSRHFGARRFSDARI